MLIPVRINIKINGASNKPVDFIRLKEADKETALIFNKIQIMKSNIISMEKIISPKENGFSIIADGRRINHIKSVYRYIPVNSSHFTSFLNNERI